jgi:hypothetical protein
VAEHYNLWMGFPNEQGNHAGGAQGVLGRLAHIWEIFRTRKLERKLNSCSDVLLPLFIRERR